MSRINTLRITISFLILSFVSFGQTKEENTYYDWFDHVVGREHTGLYNGRQYIDFDINKIFDNRHAFFYSDKALFGSVVYGGQTYYNVEMKYNLETDDLLVSLKSGAVASVLQLIYDKITGFTLGNYRFIRLAGTYEDSTIVSGFHQVIFQNTSFSLYKRHKRNRKYRIEDLEKSKVYYEFLEISRYVLNYKDMYWGITSKKDLIEAFPDHKKEIKLFYTMHKLLRKSEPNTFMKKLCIKLTQSSLLKNEL